LLSLPSRQGYHIITDNANETPAPLTAPYETTPHSEAPLTLPEYVMEVPL